MVYDITEISMCSHTITRIVLSVARIIMYIIIYIIHINIRRDQYNKLCCGVCVCVVFILIYFHNKYHFLLLTVSYDLPAKY